MQRDQLIAVIPRLRRYARLLSGDAARADDLVQDVLARACEKWHLYRPGSDLRAWLFSIMHNLNVNQWRDRAGESSIAAPAGEASVDPVPGIDTMLDLQNALRQLSIEHREVLALICVENLSYAAAADVLQVPVGTIMSRLSRARAQLRERLDPSAPQPSVRPNLRVLK